MFSLLVLITYSDLVLGTLHSWTEELEEMRQGQPAIPSSKKLDQNPPMCVKLLLFTNTPSEASLVELLSNDLLLALPQKMVTISRLCHPHNTSYVILLRYRQEETSGNC